MNRDDLLIDFGKKLREARVKKGMTQQELADLIGTSKSVISGYENGKNDPARSVLLKLSKSLDVSLNYLMGWEEDTNIEQIEPINSIKIPVVGRIPAGTPIEAIEDIIEYIDIPENWTNGNNEYFGLIVRGDSMYPLLLDGDTVVIKRQEVAETGDICACYINGYDATLKRISLTEHSITLKPENPNYPPKTYTHPGEVTIAGKVIEVRRKI